LILPLSSSTTQSAIIATSFPRPLRILTMREFWFHR
jgi:hypothetical protein